MEGHIHLDIISLASTAVGVFLFAHAVRMGAAWWGQHGGGSAATAVGAFFTLNGSNG